MSVLCFHRALSPSRRATHIVNADNDTERRMLHRPKVSSVDELRALVRRMQTDGHSGDTICRALNISREFLQRRLLTDNLASSE
jgi:hypothetical protein